MRVRVVGIGVIALCALLAVAGGLFAERPSHPVTTHEGGQPYSGTLPDELPPVPRGPMTVTPKGEATSVLQFDDGTCESGLGFTATFTWSALVDFDVPTQCIQAGLEIVGLTGKMNTRTAFSMVMFQAGASPQVGRQVVDLVPDVLPAGPCPTNQTITTRFVAPGAAVITGTQNFFAGFFHNGFPARDTNGVPAGRIWVRTPTTGGVYSPAYLTSIGFGGNWMIRVTVEDQNCVPVELQSITIS